MITNETRNDTRVDGINNAIHNYGNGNRIKNMTNKYNHIEVDIHHERGRTSDEITSESPSQGTETRLIFL